MVTAGRRGRLEPWSLRWLSQWRRRVASQGKHPAGAQAAEPWAAADVAASHRFRRMSALLRLVAATSAQPTAARSWPGPAPAAPPQLYSASRSGEPHARVRMPPTPCLFLLACSTTPARHVPAAVVTGVVRPVWLLYLSHESHSDPLAVLCRYGEHAEPICRCHAGTPRQGGGVHQHRLATGEPPRSHVAGLGGVRRRCERHHCHNRAHD